MRPGIFIPENLKPQPKRHELRTAQSLAKHGFLVEFIQPSYHRGEKTADILLDGIEYEIKSPTGSLNAVERNLKRASKQSTSVVFDSRRMKISDSHAIENELLRKLRRQNVIKAVIFINRFGSVVDLSGRF